MLDDKLQGNRDLIWLGHYSSTRAQDRNGSWHVVCTELVLVEGNEDAPIRKVLSQYSLNFADQMATIAAAAVIICYALYSVSERTVNIFGTENLIYTTPFVVYGIFRFMYLEYISNKGDNTTKIVFTDVQLIITIFAYTITTILIIYNVF